MRVSIRYQLLLPLLALMLGMAGMSTWSALAAAGRARRQLEAQMDHVVATVGSVTFPRNLQTLRLMKGLSGADFILCDASREPLRDDDRPMTTLSELPARLPEPEPASQDHPLGEAVAVGAEIYFIREAPLSPALSGSFTLFVLYPEALWRDALWQSLWPGLFLGLAGGAVAVVLTVALTQRLTRRILELKRRTGLIAAGDFSPMPLPPRDDELRDLSRSVNDMAQQLAHYQETVRQTERLRLLGQVSGGLAHQLRNGVAGARLAIQLHAHQCPASKDEALDVALRQLSLVELNLKRFLDLGRATELHLAPCNLRTLVRDVARLLAPQALHAGTDLRTPGAEGEPVQLCADAGQLQQMLLNLVSNALEAAGPNGWVEIQVGAGPEQRVFLEVCDSGPGPPAEVAARLFEPFVTGKREGVGLGLAVARQIVEAHGGAIRWFRRESATCFRVELPAALEKVGTTR